jgi:hypothetical protein
LHARGGRFAPASGDTLAVVSSPRASLLVGAAPLGFAPEQREPVAFTITGLAASVELSFVLPLAAYPMG